jgi:hypothetical protein
LQLESVATSDEFFAAMRKPRQSVLTADARLITKMLKSLVEGELFVGIDTRGVY